MMDFSFITTSFHQIMTNVLIPLGHFFAKCYNFIEHNDFFYKNLFNFLLVAGGFIYAYFAFNVSGIFEKKSQEIINSITKAEAKKEKSVEHFENTKNSLKNVDNDIRKIVEDAQNLAKNIDEKSEVMLKNELATLENRENILKDGYTQKAEKEVFENVSSAAVAVSREYIKNSLDENMHRDLIYNFINDLENMRVE